jgi:hypothetical protein
MYALQATHMFNHDKDCQMNHSYYKQEIVAGELISLDYNFQFVVGPTLNRAHNQLASIPLPTPILSKDLSEEEKCVIREQYSSCGPDALAEEGKRLTTQQKKNNDAHCKAMKPYLAICSGCGEDKLSDCHYTVFFLTKWSMRLGECIGLLTLQIGTSLPFLHMDLSKMHLHFF